jgi:DNA invertase Pin-like site-specific DNA recombinase
VKPAAVYLRVSRDDGTMSVENQRPEVMQMAAGRGYAVAPEHVFTDAESGAKGRDERPALDAMMDAAARGKFEAVFIWRLDRLSRDDTAYGGALLLADLDRFNVATLSHQQTWLDTAGPFRTPLVQFAFSMAADERKTLIDRTKRGIARARREGKVIGRPPALASAALLGRARELRAPERGLGEPPATWRYVARQLAKEGFANVPNFATLARLCTKTYPDTPRGTPGWVRSSR